MNCMETSDAVVAIDDDGPLVIGYFPPTTLKLWQGNQEAAHVGGVFLFLKTHVDEEVLFVFRAPSMKFANADFFHLLKTLDWAGTELVSHTLPPMMEPCPTMVSPPRIVEFE